MKMDFKAIVFLLTCAMIPIAICGSIQELFDNSHKLEAVPVYNPPDKALGAIRGGRTRRLIPFDDSAPGSSSRSDESIPSDDSASRRSSSSDESESANVNPNFPTPRRRHFLRRGWDNFRDRFVSRSPGPGPRNPAGRRRNAIVHSQENVYGLEPRREDPYVALRTGNPHDLPVTERIYDNIPERRRDSSDSSDSDDDSHAVPTNDAIYERLRDVPPPLPPRNRPNGGRRLSFSSRHWARKTYHK